MIDQANINAPEKRDDRTTGGTPSNDPRLADEYLERVRNMYYRSRNHTCIIGFALGGESGNGYNMYKAYQWLKSVEPSRPVICIDADGEWNTDLETSTPENRNRTPAAHSAGNRHACWRIAGRRNNLSPFRRQKPPAGRP